MAEVDRIDVLLVVTEVRAIKTMSIEPKLD